MKNATLSLLLILITSSPVLSASKYWDPTNTTGAGTGSATPGGAWDTTNSRWNTVADGTGAVTTFANGDLAIFAAGADATGTYQVSGTVTASGAGGGITIEEGNVELTGTITLGANPIIVSSGATLTTNSSLRISTTAGSTATLTGGTLRTINPGSAGTFFDTDTGIVLGAGGGTLSHGTNNILNIIQTATTITGAGQLTIDAGGGALALAGPATHTGNTVVSTGELRLRGAANRLPTGATRTTTVNSGAILNLNDQDQQLGIIAGSGRIGLGAKTLTISSSSNSTFTGTIEDTANVSTPAAPGSVGVGGKLTKASSGILTLSGANTYTGQTSLNGGRINVNNKTALGSGPVVAANAAGLQLSVSAGNTVLGNAITLNGSGANALEMFATTGNSFKQTGVIGGTGGIKRTNTGAGSLTLAGNNTYGGGTQIVDRGIVAGHTNAFGTGALTIGDATTAPTAGITVSSDQALTVGNAVTVNRDFGVSGSNQLEMSGTVDLGAATRSINVTNSADTILSGVISNGGLTKDGAGKLILTGANTYVGTTTVNAGKLQVNGSLAGDVTVAGGTLGGNGTIAGSVTMNSGTVGAGGSIGTINTGALTLNSGNYDFEFSFGGGTVADNAVAVGADLWNVSGLLTIMNAVTLVGTDLGTIAAIPATKFTVFTYTSAAADFRFGNALVDDSTITLDGVSFVINYDDTVGGLKAVTLRTPAAVPELSSILTVGLAGVFAFGAIRLGKRFGLSFKV